MKTRFALPAVLAIALSFFVSFGARADAPIPIASGSPVPQTAFDALVESYFDGWFKMHPSQATMSGFHDRDGELEDYSAAQVKKEVEWLRGYETRVAKFPEADLKPEESIDRELLLNTIRAVLLEDETVKSWQKNPDRYGSQVSNAIFPIMSRKFATPEERLKSIISREKKIPFAFAAARANLKNPPKIFTDIALEQLPGTSSFFKDDVPAAFADTLKNPANAKLSEEFKKANDAVLAGLASYEAYLKKTVLPHSKGDFRLGADVFAKKLKFEEMIDLPLDKLLKVGMDNLHENQELFKQVSAMIDPNRNAQAILEELVHDHPTADKLLDAFRDRVNESRSFIEAHHLATIPSLVPPILEETPSFERALFFASLDPPGPYETQAKEAYFNVTLPEPTWSKERIEEHLQGYNRGTILSTAVHEAYPGHYLQFLWLPQVNSKVRKLLGVNSYIEGWAHYGEQMMLDQGLGGNDPKLKLGQLQDALLRNARFVVSIEMHTGKMTYDQAIDFFVKEGYQSRANGEREAKRGTSDATYLYYTAGKLEIFKLRDDYRKLKGGEYSLQKFHDEFLKQGPLPIKLMRKVMLGGNEAEIF